MVSCWTTCIYLICESIWSCLDCISYSNSTFYFYICLSFSSTDFVNPMISTFDAATYLESSSYWFWWAWLSFCCRSRRDWRSSFRLSYSWSRSCWSFITLSWSCKRVWWSSISWATCSLALSSSIWMFCFSYLMSLCSLFRSSIFFTFSWSWTFKLSVISLF